MLLIAKAAARSDARKLLGTVARRRLSGLLVLQVSVLAPVLVWFATRRIHEEVGAGLRGQADFVESVLVALSIAVAVSGFSIGGLLPDEDAVGLQLRVSPISSRLAAIAAVLPSLLVLVSVALVTVGTFLATLFAGVNGAWALTTNGAAVTLSLGVTSVAAGHTARLGLVRVSAVLLGATAAWTITGVILGGGFWGPIRATAQRHPAAGLAALLMAGVTTATWIRIMCSSPATSVRSHRPWSPTRLPARGFGLHYTLALLTLFRRPDTRRHVAGLAIGALVGTATLTHVGGWPVEIALNLTLMVTAAGSLVLVLMAYSYAVEAAWLWGTTPGSPSVRLGATLAAGITLAGVAFCVASVPLSFAVGATLDAWISVAYGLVALTCPAILAASVFPVHRNADGFQYVSHAVFIGLAIAWVPILTRASSSIPLPPPVAELVVAGLIGPSFAVLVARHLHLTSINRREP